MRVSAEQDSDGASPPPWNEIHRWAEREYLQAVEALLSPRSDPQKTAYLRGRCAALQELSRLPVTLARERTRKAQFAAQGET